MKSDLNGAAEGMLSDKGGGMSVIRDRCVYSSVVRCGGRASVDEISQLFLIETRNIDGIATLAVVIGHKTPSKRGACGAP